MAVDAANVPRVESELESVVVHAAGASCLRRARCQLPPGARSVRLTGLPVALFTASLRGRVVQGPPGLRVTDIRFDLDVELDRMAELPQLRQDLAAADARHDEATARLERIGAEIDETAELRPVRPQARRGEPPREAPVDALLALAGFVDGRLALLHQELAAAERENRRTEQELEVAERRVEQASTALRTARARATGTAVLTLEGTDESSGGPVESELELEYHVPGAAWVPVYQLRLGAADSGGGTLVLRASVAQRTGEDWNGVRLGLSTADLHRRTDLPELRSLRIGRRQEPRPAPAWREPPGGLAELFAGYDAGRADEPLRQPVRAARRSKARAARPQHALEARSEAGATADPRMDWMGEEQERGESLAMSYVPSAPAQPGAAMPVAYGASAPAPASAPPQQFMQQSAPQAPPAFAAGLRSNRTARPPGRPGRAVAASLGREEPDTPAFLADAPAPPPPEPESLAPAVELLDYAALVLSGPEAGTVRGTLRPARAALPATVGEYRRRAEAVSRLPVPAHAVHVRYSAGSFDYRFDTAAPVDVESDGVWHTVPVSEIEVELREEYVCVPSVDEAVYGTVVLTNTSGHALLAGPADVTVDGDFLMTVPLQTLAPGASRRVGIGVAESVQAARRTRMKESTAGLRAGTSVLDHRIEVELANRLPRTVSVEVRERVPVSTEKDVRIEEHRAIPAWTDADAEGPGRDEDTFVRGTRIWRVELHPGAKTVLTGGYEIRIPAGKALVGGNRRN